MLLLADGLFRLDVAISGDTLRTFVRNLSSGQLRMRDGTADAAGASIVLGDAAAYEPARAGVAFTLGSGADQIYVEGTIGTLRFVQRGTIKVSIQAVVRGTAAPRR